MLLTIAGVALVFVMRVIDVSINTVRIVVMMRGNIRLAAPLGFFESLSWITAASLVFANLGNPVRAMGTAFVRVVAPLGTDQVAPRLREEGFPVTVVNAHGRDGEVRLSFTVMPRKRVKQALAIVQQINPEAFVTVEEAHLLDLERLRRSSTVRK